MNEELRKFRIRNSEFRETLIVMWEIRELRMKNEELRKFRIQRDVDIFIFIL